MAESEKRKAYPKLVRQDYEFPEIQDGSDQEDLADQVRHCDCAPTAPNLDPLTPNCTVIEYVMCGTPPEDADLDDLPVFYLRKRSEVGAPNVIYVFSEEACFAKGDDLDCAEAEGRVLALDEYLSLDESEAEPCEGLQCNPLRCPFLILEICDNDPEADTVEPPSIILPRSFFNGLTLGRKTVVYQGHCYTTPSIPCREEQDEASAEIEFEDIEIVSNCESDSCAGCCGGAAEDMVTLVTGLKERLRFVNAGVLPPDYLTHTWSDAAYILNNSPNEINGHTEATACNERYEDWRTYLLEIDFWLYSQRTDGLATEYLYNNFTNLPSTTQIKGWLDSNTYPTSDVDGVAVFSDVDRFNGTDFDDQITATEDVSWYRNTFGGPNAGGEIYTIGGEGGYGTISVIRFGDTDPHVVVNDAVNQQPWCNLVADTIDRLLTAIQRLKAVEVSKGSAWANSDERRADENTPTDSCDDVRAANIAAYALAPWNAHGVNVPAFTEALSYDSGSDSSTGHLIAVRSKASVDLSVLGTGVAKIYLDVFTTRINMSSPLVYAGNSPPVAADDLFHLYDVAVTGSPYTSSYVGNNSSPTFAVLTDCPIEVYNNCIATCEATGISCVQQCDDNYVICFDGCGGSIPCEEACSDTQAVCESTCNADQAVCEADCGTLPPDRSIAWLARQVIVAVGIGTFTV